MKNYKIGQIVYIYGIWKAKIISFYKNSVRCNVYEGLPSTEKPPQEYNYPMKDILSVRLFNPKHK